MEQMKIELLFEAEAGEWFWFKEKPKRGDKEWIVKVIEKYDQQRDKIKLKLAPFNFTFLEGKYTFGLEDNIKWKKGELKEMIYKKIDFNLEHFYMFKPDEEELKKIKKKLLLYKLNNG